ncbi:hypothetical protein PACILC2_51580 [Paenibacillus cisolokensis]|uniref:Holin n=1 Tax=Paenibacillus cisolokensis TaxID=1658519 RepID=A0ABQ4NEF4_9BACL|nr:hypothetical protein [Paenibacillus cisolokensis]GIQ66590.1 hypothetical protein PACILC2_51580 [Paenibacillus cisolokensis]
MNILPDNLAMISVVALAVIMNVVSVWLPKKAATAAEILLAAAALTGLFVRFPVGQAILLTAIGAHAYAAFSELIDRNKREMRMALRQNCRKSGRSKSFSAKMRGDWRRMSR